MQPIEPCNWQRSSRKWVRNVACTLAWQRRRLHCGIFKEFRRAFANETNVTLHQTKIQCGKNRLEIFAFGNNASFSAKKTYENRNVTKRNRRRTAPDRITHLRFHGEADTTLKSSRCALHLRKKSIGLLCLSQAELKTGVLQQAQHFLDMYHQRKSVLASLEHCNEWLTKPW